MGYSKKTWSGDSQAGDMNHDWNGLLKYINHTGMMSNFGSPNISFYHSYNLYIKISMVTQVNQLLSPSGNPDPSSSRKTIFQTEGCFYHQLCPLKCIAFMSKNIHSSSIVETLSFRSHKNYT